MVAYFYEWFVDDIITNYVGFYRRTIKSYFWCDKYNKKAVITTAIFISCCCLNPVFLLCPKIAFLVRQLFECPTPASSPLLQPPRPSFDDQPSNLLTPTRTKCVHLDDNERNGQAAQKKPLRLRMTIHKK